MKCCRCGYQEIVPRWILEEMCATSQPSSFDCICPRCDSTMYIPEVAEQHQKKKKPKAKKKKRK